MSPFLLILGQLYRPRVAMSEIYSRPIRFWVAVGVYTFHNMLLEVSYVRSLRPVHVTR